MSGDGLGGGWGCGKGCVRELWIGLRGAVFRFCSCSWRFSSLLDVGCVEGAVE